MQDLLVFEVSGAFAHFRKYYTNSSSLTYSFPPRTALMGMVAAVLGWERDSYYEKLGPSQAHFAVEAVSPVRRIMQTVNYVRTKSTDLRKIHLGVPGTQTPLEILAPGIGKNKLIFRIYFYHKDRQLMNQLEQSIREGKTYYPLYLGISEFIASFSFIARLRGEDLKALRPGEVCAVNTVCNTALLDMVDFTKEPDAQYIREKAPYVFGEGREVRPPASFILEKNQKPLWAKFKEDVYRVGLFDGERNICFMEQGE